MPDKIKSAHQILKEIWESNENEDRGILVADGAKISIATAGGKFVELGSIHKPIHKENK